jgi:hypothetical protein
VIMQMYVIGWLKRCHKLDKTLVLSTT